MASFLVLLLAYTLSQFYRSFLAVVSADLTRDLSLDPAELGSLSATWFAAFAFAQFPVGYALDRYGPRATISLGMIAAVAGAVLLARANGYGTGVAAMALIGIGCSPIYMGSLYIVARERPEQFALLSAAILGIGSVGNLLGATPLVLAAEYFGWRGSFLAIAAMTAISAGAIWLVVRDPPRLETTDRDDSLVGGLVEILHVKTLWLLFPLAFTSYAVAIATRAVWVAPFLTSSYGLAPEPLGNVVLAFAIAMSVGALATGAIAGWIGVKTISLVGNLIVVLTFLALGFGVATSVASAAVAFVVLGLAGVTYAVLMEHARQFMPGHLIGRGITFINFAFIGGAGLVQWVSGHAVKRMLDSGTAPALAYQHLFVGFAVIVALPLAIYALAPVRPTAQPSRPSA